MPATHNCKVLASLGAKVRVENSTSNVSIATMPVNTLFQIDQIISDMDDPTNPKKIWGRIFGGANEGKFTALDYPNSSGTVEHISSYQPIDIVVEPPPTNPDEVLRIIESTVTYETVDHRIVTQRMIPYGSPTEI